MTPVKLRTSSTYSQVGRYYKHPLELLQDGKWITSNATTNAIYGVAQFTKTAQAQEP